MTEEYNNILKLTFKLIEKKILTIFCFQFVYNLMICSKNHNNKPIEEFILVSPAPVDTAAKLSSIFINLSNKVKHRSYNFSA